METLLIVLHITVCLFLIVIVLLQHGKGADIGATFGGAGQSVFGTEGPLPLLNKITTSAAILFMVTSVALAYLSSHRGTSIMSGIEQAPPPQPAPIETPVAEQGPITVPMPTADAEGGDVPSSFPLQGGDQPSSDIPAESASH